MIHMGTLLFFTKDLEMDIVLQHSIPSVTTKVLHLSLLKPLAVQLWEDTLGSAAWSSKFGYCADNKASCSNFTVSALDIPPNLG